MATPTATATATASATPLPPTATPTATPTPGPGALFYSLPLTPGDPQPILNRFRILSLYGHPSTEVLGPLGMPDRDAMIAYLWQWTTDYQAQLPDERIIPGLHFIGTAANRYPGEDGLYRRQTRLDLIQEWIDLAEANQFMFFIDIQRGLAPIDWEFDRIEPLLHYPFVHLAIDPEYSMDEGEAPRENLGHYHAEDINWLQEQLEAIALEIGMNKILIVHQFEYSMVREKRDIQNYPHVELVIDADGIGMPSNKLADYNQYAACENFEYGGIKLYVNHDTPLMPIADILQIRPLPVIFIYQ